MTIIINPHEIYIYGSGQVAEIIADYALQANIKIKAFIDHNSKKNNIRNIPVIEYSKIKEGPEYKTNPIFVAIGYKELNKFRSEKIDFLIKEGWDFANLVFTKDCSKNKGLKGLNIFIAKNVSLQPFSKIESGVFIWDNSVIGHHTTIEFSTWITSGTVVGGNVLIGNNCFLGLNSSISHMIKIGEYSFIGAGTLLSKSLDSKSVVIRKGDKISSFDADFFARSGMLK